MIKKVFNLSQILFVFITIISCNSTPNCSNYEGNYEFIEYLKINNESRTYSLSIKNQGEKYLIKYQDQSSKDGLKNQLEFLAACDNGLLVAAKR